MVTICGPRRIGRSCEDVRNVVPMAPGTGDRGPEDGSRPPRDGDRHTVAGLGTPNQLAGLLPHLPEAHFPHALEGNTCATASASARLPLA